VAGRNQRAPTLIGHRGAAAVAPENTLASLAAALAAGVDRVEFDVRLTADDVPVLIHDATLDRTTDARGALAERTVAELGAVDAGAWFAPRFAGERIPTLTEALDALEGRARAIVELKSDGDEGARLRDVVLDVLARRRDPSAFVFTSMDWNLLAGARDRVPGLDVAVTVHHRERRDAVEAAIALRASAIHPYRRRAGVRAIARAHAAGLAVRAYTVNEIGHLRPLVRAGVDAVFTDDPARLATLLAAHADGP